MSNNIKCTKKIGQGVYGNIYSTTNNNLACKQFIDFTDGFSEIQYYVLSNLNKTNQNCIKMHYVEFKLGRNSTIIDFSDNSCHNKYDNDKLESKLFMYIEKFDSNLRIVKQVSSCSKIDNRLIMFYLFKSYDNLYQNFIIHGDLKLDNILIKNMVNMFGSKIYRPYICDFGLSIIHVNNLPGSYDLPDLNYIQTINYRAPELMFGDCHFDYKIDIWSIGVIMLKLYNKLDKSILDCCSYNKQIVSLFRFFGNNHVNNYLESINANYKKNGQKNTNNKSMKPLIIENLKHDNDHQMIDLITKLLELNPKNRITMKEIFEHPYFREYGLTYQFNERNPIAFLNNYFDANGIKYNDIFKINSIMPKQARFTMYSKMCKSIKLMKPNSNYINYELVLRTIYLFDEFLVKSDKKYMRHEYIFMLQMLCHLVYNPKKTFDYHISQKYIINSIENEHKQIITWSHADDLFHDLMINLNFVTSIPTYLNYLPEITNFNNYQSNYNVSSNTDMWKLLMYVVADINHYKYPKYEIIKFLFDITSCILPINFQYNTLFNDLINGSLSVLKLDHVTTNNIKIILHH